MQDVQRRAGVERVVQVPRQPRDIPHIIDIRRIFARLDARPAAVPEHLARIRVRDPEDQPVSRDVVGYGAAGVVGAGEIVEARGLAVNAWRVEGLEDVLPPLAELRTLVRILIECVLLTGEINHARRYTQLGRDLARVGFGCFRSA